MKTMPAEKVTSKTENRRSNKPLMEKRRRARINQSLSELKNLILDAIKKDTSRSSKLEKADILEMAVKHLQNLQKQQINDTNTGSKYRAGFNECATEVTRFLETADGIDAAVRSRLVNHLFNCLNKLCSNETSDNVQNSADSTSKSDVTTDLPTSKVGASNQSSITTTPMLQPIQVQIPSTVPRVEVTSTDHASTTVSLNHSEASISTDSATTTIVHGLQLIPTRLSNGEIAFVLPNQTFRSSVEHLPERNNNTISATCTLSPSLALSTSLATSITERGACLLMPTSHVISSTDSSLQATASMDSCSSSDDHGQRHRRPSPPVTTTACQTSPPEDIKQHDGHFRLQHVQDQSNVKRENPSPNAIKECTECVWRPW